MTTDDTKAEDEALRAADGTRVDRLLERLMDRTGGRVGAQTVFGEPIQRGELTVVPVARARWFFGVGAGSGPTAGAATEAMGSGSGAGGGAGVNPVGFLEITPSGAVFKPIADAYPSPLFLLAVGLTTALVLRALGRLLRG